MSNTSLNVKITGLATQIGDIVPIDIWAEKSKIKNAKTGKILSGKAISRVMGIRSKSWHPEIFGNPKTIVELGLKALESAEVEAGEIDCLITVSCTPYEIKLSQDSFRFAREFKLEDDVLHLQVEAGCGGLARAVHLAQSLKVQRILLLSYNCVSPLLTSNESYKENNLHPQKSIIWGSPTIFSDGAGALVLERCEEKTGFYFYSRDQISFGNQPGFGDSIVSHLGGGTLNPIKNPEDLDLNVFAMSGRIIGEYYNRGMVLNYERITREFPDFLAEVNRIFIHQAGPHLVKDFFQLTGVNEAMVPTNCSRLGNLVSPCTLHLLHEELLCSGIEKKDKVIFCLVGAGPERGAFGIKTDIKKIVPMGIGYEKKHANRTQNVVTKKVA